MIAVYRFGRIELRPATRELVVAGAAAAVGGRAFNLLLVLIERRDRMVPKNELLDLVWPGLVVEENNLQVQISALRKVLGPQAIATIPGQGYRFAIALEEGAKPETETIAASALPAPVPATRAATSAATARLTNIPSHADAYCQRRVVGRFGRAVLRRQDRSRHRQCRWPATG